MRLTLLLSFHFVRVSIWLAGNQGMVNVERGTNLWHFISRRYVRLFVGQSTNILDMWRMLGRSLINGVVVVGTIIKSKLGLQPKPFGEACYAFWQEEIYHDEQQVFCQMNECIPEVEKAVRACVNEAGAPKKCFSANIAAGSPVEMVTRGRYVL